MMDYQYSQKKNENLNANEQKEKSNVFSVIDEEGKELEEYKIQKVIDVSDPDYVYKLDSAKQSVIDGEIISASRLLNKKGISSVSEKRRKTFLRNLEDSKAATTILGIVKTEAEAQKEQAEETDAQKAKRLEKSLMEITQLDLKEFAYDKTENFLNRNGFLESYRKLLAIKTADKDLDELLDIYEKKGKVIPKPENMTDNVIQDLRARIAVFQEMEKDYSEMLSIMASPYYSLLTEKDMQNELESLDTKKLTALTAGKTVPKAFSDYIDMLKARKIRQDSSEGGSYYKKNVSTEALLNYYRKQYTVNSPVADLSRALSNVMSETKWSGDSSTMKAIKKGIKKLSTLYGADNKEELIKQYDWLTFLMENYLSTKDTQKGMYADRHKKVQILLNSMKLHREKMAFEDPESAQNAFSDEFFEAWRMRNKDDELNNITAKVNELLFKKVPRTEEEFESDKAEMAKRLDDVIAYLKTKKNGACIREKLKLERLSYLDRIDRIERYKDSFLKRSFEKERPDKNLMIWGNNLLSVKVIDSKYISEHSENNYVGTEEGGLQEEGLRFLADKFNALDCFVLGQKYVFKDLVGPEGEEEEVKQNIYVYQKDQGKMLTDAIAEADKLGLPLMYSDHALEQLQTIQMIDFILGQTGRNQDSFVVNYQVKCVENQNYLVISDVKARNHIQSLGDESFDEINKESDGNGIQTRQLINSKGLPNLAGYNTKVAGKIVTAYSKTVLEAFRSMGLEEKKCQLLKERLEKLQDALSKDSEEGGFQYEVDKVLEKIKKDPGLAGDLRQSIREQLNKKSAHTYINSALIQDTGKLDLEEVSKLNQDFDKDLNASKVVYERKKFFDESLEKNRKGFAGENLKTETKEVLDVIELYQEINIPPQRLYMGYKGYWDVVRKLEPAKYQKLMEETRSELIASGKMTEDETNVEEMRKAVDEKLRKDTYLRQYVIHIKDRRLKDAIKRVNDRITALKAMEKRGKYEEEELAQMEEYKKRLDPGNMNGELVVGKEGVHKEYKDSQFSNYYILREEKETALFPEPPSSMDVYQGQVGDCYFLAVLGSVVEADPSFIMRHMKDNGDNTVTCKFYKPNEQGGFDDIYVTVDKSCAHKEQDGKIINVGAFGSFWVQMYEKAFAVSGLAHVGRKYEKGEFDWINGGLATYAYSWITGKKAKTVFDNADIGDPVYRITSLNSKFKKKDELGRTFMSDEFKQHAKKDKEKMKKVLDAGGIVSAEAYIELLDSDSVGNCGEAVRRGLVGRHVYSVFGFETIDGKDYVRIRNPWSSRVGYNKNELTGKVVMTEADRSKLRGTCLVDFETFYEHMSGVFYIDKMSEQKG